MLQTVSLYTTLITVTTYKQCLTLGKRIFCQSNNIKDYIMLATVTTLDTINKLRTYKQSLSYQESKIILDQLVL